MANAKIMIVESDPAVAKDIEERLTTLGYTICAIVSSKAQAITKVTEVRPDLVLIDMDVEGEMDGVDIAQKIYNRFDIPVIYLTNHVNEDLLDKVRTTRAFGHVFKPYGTDQLHLSIENHLYWYQEDQRFRKGEQQLTTICNNISDAVIATDLKGLVTFMNPAAESLTGWQLEAASGVNIKQVLLVDTKKDCPVAAILRSILHPDTATAPEVSTDSAEIHEGRLISRSDQDIQVSYSAVPWINQNGEGIGVVITCRDTTDYRVIEERLNQTISELQNQTQLMDIIFNNMSDGVLVADEKGGYIMANPAMQQMTGQHFEELDFLMPLNNMVFLTPRQNHCFPQTNSHSPVPSKVR
jgi:PAS domain S-box-containing protein